MADETIEIEDPTPERLVHLAIVLAGEGDSPVWIRNGTVNKISE